jgi:hypothetical protein
MLGLPTLLWALAEGGGPTFSVAYRAASSCPTQAQLEAAIVARAPVARTAVDAQVRFDVDLAPEPGQKRRLRVALDDGTSQDREIDADDCAEAAQSVAVIAAMILASRPAPEPKIEPEEPERPPAPAKPQPRPRAVAPVPQTRPTWLTASAGAGLESSAAPGPTFAASGSVDFGTVARGVLAPSLRLTALYGRAANASTSAGEASFQLALARLHPCALRLAAGGGEARLCGVLEGGALLAAGVDARNERSQTMPWLGAGLAVLGGWALSPRLGVDVAVGVRALLVRDEFIFAPTVEVHQPSVIATDFRLGVSYRLW